MHIAPLYLLISEKNTRQKCEILTRGDNTPTDEENTSKGEGHPNLLANPDYTAIAGRTSRAPVTSQLTGPTLGHRTSDRSADKTLRPAARSNLDDIALHTWLDHTRNGSPANNDRMFATFHFQKRDQTKAGGTSCTASRQERGSFCRGRGFPVWAIVGLTNFNVNLFLWYLQADKYVIKLKNIRQEDIIRAYVSRPA